MSDIKRIVVPTGTFTPDVVLATAVLVGVHPDAEIVRTNNYGAANADFVVGVDWMEHPEAGYFGHNQHSEEKCEECGEYLEHPYTCAKLVWDYFGKRFVETMSLASGDIEAVTNNVYWGFIAYMDRSEFSHGRPVHPMWNSIIGMNLGGDQPASLSNEELEILRHDCFLKAVEFATFTPS